jgi:membrane protein DedA with SNARE-associated domain
MGISEWLFGAIVSGISSGGYPAVFVLMALESMIAPVPSEAVMPFAGYLVATGRFELWLVGVASSAGSIVGSLVSYYTGLKGGRPLVHRWGRYLLLDHGHLEWTARWFERHGQKTIFISRFIPVVRHLISIPAGMARMPLPGFVLYTLVGATLWNCFLAWCGLWLGEHWGLVHEYSRELDIAVAGGLAAALLWHVVRHRRQAARRLAEASAARLAAKPTEGAK